MNTAGKVGLAAFLGLAIFGVSKAIHATETANAAERLTIDIDGIKIKKLNKSGIFPTGAVYTIDLSFGNPTAKDIEVSQLYTVLSVKKAGVLSRIANTSKPSGEMIIIKGNDSTKYSHDIEIRFANVLGLIPNFSGYLIDRLRGEPSTQQIIADISLTALGVTIPIQEPINI